MSERVSNRVIERRKATGLTQEELAAALGVSRQTIISIERGKYVPSLPLALRLARYFGCATEELFTIEEEA